MKHPKLNFTPEELATYERIQEAAKKFLEAEHDLAQASATCKHRFSGPTNSWAICDICSKCFGWTCDQSPDHVCHYYSGGGFVHLIDNNRVRVPKGHDEQYETTDNCIFCGQPNERK